MKNLPSIHTYTLSEHYSLLERQVAKTVYEAACAQENAAYTTVLELEITR